MALVATMAFFTASTVSANVGTAKNDLVSQDYAHHRRAERRHRFVCLASWYGPGLFGRTKADGKRYDKTEVFVAHRSLPLGTALRVTNLGNGRTIFARVEDRGPYVRGRNLDLSYEAALRLNAIDRGVISVSYEIVERN